MQRTGDARCREKRHTEDLLTAVDDHGCPVHALRAKGAELLLKDTEEFESIDPETAPWRSSFRRARSASPGSSTRTTRA